MRKWIITLVALAFVSVAVAYTASVDGGVSAALGRFRPFTALQEIIRGTDSAVERQETAAAVPKPEPVATRETEPPKPKATAMTLYFPDSEAMHLVPESRDIPDGGADAVRALEELFKGPADTAHGPIVPPGTKAPGVTVAKGVATVDMDPGLKAKGGGSTEETMLVYSIVQTLTGLDGIRSVRFVVGGKDTDTLYGHLDLSAPIESDPSMVESNG